MYIRETLGLSISPNLPLMYMPVEHYM